MVPVYCLDGALEDNFELPLILNQNVHGRPAWAVYIGRGSKWGNPFVIGRHGTRAEVIAKYEAWLRDQHHLLRDLHELRGKTIVCFCAPAQCHGEVLHQLANLEREDLVAWWRQRAGNEGQNMGRAA